MSEHAVAPTTGEISEDHQHSHGLTYGGYVMVWAVLVALTSVTVTIAGINLGSVTLIAAMLIACIKTFMVANYFMHVKFDNRIIKIFILICILLFVIFLTLTFSDLSYR